MLQAHWGELAALATAVCWTATAMAFEIAAKKVGSLALNISRLVLAFIFLGFYTWITRGLFLPLDASPSVWGWLLLSGFIGFTIGDLLLFQAFIEIGARISMLIMAMVPPITSLITWIILGDTITGAEALGILITVTGVAWVVFQRTPEKTTRFKHPLRGVLLALGGAVGQAIGLVFSKKGMGSYSAFAATQIRTLAGIGGFAILIMLRRQWRQIFHALKNTSALRPLFVGAFFGPFLGVSLSLVAVQLIHPGVAATFMAIVPVLIIPPAHFILKERIHWREATGALIALSGIGILYLT